MTVAITDGTVMCRRCGEYAVECPLCEGMGPDTMDTPWEIRQKEKELTESMKPIPSWVYYH